MIKDENRDKGFRDGDPSWGGSHEGGEVSTQQETLSQAGLQGVLESQKATSHTWERKKKKKNPTEYTPNCNFGKENFPQKALI